MTTEEAMQKVAEKKAGENPETKKETNADTEAKTKEVFEQFKKDNEGKTDDEINVLIKAKTEKDTTNATKLKALTEEIKGRTENKGKSETELKDILTQELKKKPDTKNEPPPEKPKTLNELISEHTKGSFADMDALLSRANEPKDTFANEQIEHLNKLAKDGVDIMDVLKYQALGIDKLETTDIEQAKELIKHELRLSKPGITERELEFELKLNYDLELKKETNDDGEEVVVNAEAVEMAKLKLFRDARDTKEKLILKQKELEIPKKNGFSQEQADQLKLQWNKSVDASLKDISEIPYDLGDGNVFNLALDETQKTQLKTSMIDIDNFFNRYRSNGQTDMTKYIREMAMLNDPNYTKNLFDQGKSAGAEEAINNISNISTDVAGRGEAPQYKTPQQMMAEEIKKNEG